MFARWPACIRFVIVVVAVIANGIVMRTLFFGGVLNKDIVPTLLFDAFLVMILWAARSQPRAGTADGDEQ